MGTPEVLPRTPDTRRFPALSGSLIGPNAPCAAATERHCVGMGLNEEGKDRINTGRFQGLFEVHQKYF